MADSTDYFAELGIAPSASEAEMKRAYRLRSRVLHPDKRPDVDPAIAAEEFNRLNIAYEVLLDPAARLAAMEKFKAEQARKARQGAYEGKRKAMVDELERREQEGKKARRDEQDRIRERERTLEKLREEGKRLREEKDRKRAEMEASVQHETQPPPETAKTTVNVGPEPELGPLDLTVRVRFPPPSYAAFSSASENTNGASASTSASGGLDDGTSTTLARALSRMYGPLDALVFTPLKPKEKEKKAKARDAYALATFKCLDAAYAAVLSGSGSPLSSAPSNIERALGLEQGQIRIGWASAPKEKGKKRASAAGPTDGAQDGVTASSEFVGSEAAMPGEPARVAWLRSQGLLDSRTNSASRSNHANGHKTSSGERERKESAGNDGSPIRGAENGTADTPMKRRTNGLNMDKPSRTDLQADEETRKPPPSFSFSANSFSLNSSSGTTSGTGVESSAPSGGADYESATLLRLRQAERQRLEEEIRKIDELDGAS